MKKLKRVSAFIAAAVMAVSMQSAVFAEAEVTIDDVTAPAADELSLPQNVTANFSLPQNIRATMITPSVDFYTEGATDETTVKAQLDDIYTKAAAIGLNAVYINTVYDGTAFFSTEMNRTDVFDPLTLAIETAAAYSLRAYLIYDVNYILSTSPSASAKLDTLISETHRFAIKYICDGILLSDYYSAVSPESYADYMENGSGIGYENWLYDTSELYFSTAGDVIHMTDNSVPVGMLVSDMWANYENDPLGSETYDDTEAYYTGYCDTKKFLKKGYADFITVCAKGSMTSSILPFEEVTGWWGTLASECALTMYVLIYNEKQGTDEKGWYGDDQLLRQLSTAKESGSYGGCVFNSYNTLITETSVTDNITKFFADEINEESLFEDLIMQSPSQFSFTTYEPYVDFMGTFDENFDVYFNGDKITLNSAGNFYFEEPLDVGSNKFTIEHKGVYYTYKIERKIITIKSLDDSIADGKSLLVDGDTKITISAVAYKGATVTATLNGKTVSLKETDKTIDDDPNSSFALFTAQYTVPSGIIGKAQSLGTISVTSSYLGYSRTLTGASVTVNAEPEPVKVDIDPTLYDQNSVGTGEIVGTMGAVHTTGETVKYIKVANDYTTVYDGKTTGDIPSPLFAQLPAGTLDYYSSTSGSYYISESGKRFDSDDVSVFTDTGIGTNPLTVNSVGTSGGDGYIKIKLGTKTGYNIDYVGNSYYTGTDGDYNVSDFTATYVNITFDNITSVTKLPSFENNLVFSAGTWETVTINGIPKFRLVLKLRQPGVYGGCAAFYNSSGELVLCFEVMTNSLSSMTIVIDPGHGYCRYATVFDPGAVGHITEYEANIGIAKQLKTQLEALGAKVVLIPTDTSFILTTLRPAYGRSYGCDLFISLHANKVVNSESTRGTEVYYFTPFSQPLASAISANVSSYFTNNVYSDGANKNRGAKYSYYWVTLQQDFPSVLVETGFVSNYTEAMAMVNATHQKGIATAIVNGIKTYIGRSSISYASDGTSGIVTQTTAYSDPSSDSPITIPVVTTPASDTTPPPEVITIPAGTTAPESESESESTSATTTASTAITFIVSSRLDS